MANESVLDIKKLAKSKGFAVVALNIGAGENNKEGYLSLDAFTKADIQAPMWQIPIPDNSVDQILCEQALEHLSKFEVIPTLREWLRVLKVGAIVKIIVPDLEWVCFWWLTHQTVEWDLDIIYGNQKHPGEFHKTGFTPRILKMYVEICGGFEINSIEYSGGDLTNLKFNEEQMGGTVNGRNIKISLTKKG